MNVEHFKAISPLIDEVRHGDLSVRNALEKAFDAGLRFRATMAAPIGLTVQQRALLAFIFTYTESHNGVTPSFEEMKNALGLRSKSGIHRIVQALEERGAIVRLPNRARAIGLVRAA